MKHLAVILLVLVGCAPVGGHKPIPTPAPTGEISAASEAFPAAYSAAMAKAARDTAEKCDSFTSWADLYDSWQADNTAARSDSFKPLEDLLTAKLNPKDAPWDAAKAKAVLIEASEGFERAGK